MMTEQEKIAITKYDLMYEQQMTRVETTLENMNKNMDLNFKDLKSDFRWLFGLMVVFSGSLLTVMAKGFQWF